MSYVFLWVHRFLILDQLKARLDHFKLAMYKVMEALLFTSVLLLGKQGSSLWVIK